MKAGRIGAVAAASRRKRQNSGAGAGAASHGGGGGGAAELSERDAEAMYYRATQEERVATSQMHKQRWGTMSWRDRYRALEAIRAGVAADPAPQAPPHPHPLQREQSDEVTLDLDDPPRMHRAPTTPNVASPADSSAPPVAYEVEAAPTTTPTTTTTTAAAAPRNDTRVDVEVNNAGLDETELDGPDGAGVSTRSDGAPPPVAPASPPPTAAVKSARRTRVKITCAMDIGAHLFLGILALVSLAAGSVSDCPDAHPLVYVYFTLAPLAYIILGVGYFYLYKFAYFSGRGKDDPLVLWRVPGRDSRTVRRWSRIGLALQTVVVAFGILTEVVRHCEVVLNYCMLSAVAMFLCAALNFVVFRL